MVRVVRASGYARSSAIIRSATRTVAGPNLATTSPAASLASRTRFGGIVVQGGIITAILNAVVAEELPGPGTVFLHVDWSFKAPVRPRDVITGEVEITRVRDDKPITEMATRVIRGDGTVVVDGTAVCYTMPLA